MNSPVHSSIGTPSTIQRSSTACRHTVSGSVSLRSRGSFHLSLTVLCAIGRSVVFCLGWWSTLLPTRFLVSRGTLDTGPLDFLSPTRVSLSAPLLPRSFGLKGFDFCRSSTPDVRRCPVWALPCSLAATWGISFDYFSSGYLDVSVHRVPFRTLWIGVRMTGVLPAGFPHSDICGSKIICISPQLFAAYHVFLRLLVPRHPPCALLCLISSMHSVASLIT